MKYHQFHAAAQAEWEAQRKRIADAVAQCDHVATPEEVAAAEAALTSGPSKPQGDLNLAPAA